MVFKRPTDALDKEVRLVDKMDTAAQGFLDELATEDADAARLVKHWKDYLKGWRKLSADLKNMDDGARNDELTKEIARLKKFRDTLAGDNSDAAKFYRDLVLLISMTLRT